MRYLVIDLSIICIIVFCAYRGYRNGLIRGAFGVVALIVALFLANTISKAYAEEFTGALTPFASGIMESSLFGLSTTSQISEAEDTETSGFSLNNVDINNIDISELDFGDIDVSGIDLDTFQIDDITIASLRNAPEKFIASYLALRQLGMTDAASTHIAHVTTQDESGRFLPDIVGTNLSYSLTYIALFGISFLLISIVFTIIGNLIGVVFTLPGLKLVDGIIGIGFGFVKGLIIVLAIGVVVRYFGLLAYDTLDGTTLLKHIANNNLLANMLGV